MSKQRRDSLARSGWYPIKTYNHAIYELEIEGVIEIRKRMVEWKKGLYYRFTPAGLARQKNQFPRVMQLAAAFDGLPTDDALLIALRGAYADHLHETLIKPLVLADRRAALPMGSPRRNLKR